MVRKYLLPLAVLILVFSALPASVIAGGTPTTCYPPLSLVTTSVPSATAGSSYTVQLAANGGQPPYSWSFGQSSLPKGFSINSSGSVSGTPETAGTFTFNVVLSDSLKNNVTGALTLIVASAPTGTGGTGTTVEPGGTGTTGTGGTGTTGTGGTGTTGTGGTGTTGTGGTGTTGTGGTGTTGTGGTGTTGTGGTGTTGTGGTGTTGTGGTGTTGTGGTGTTGTGGTGTTGTGGTGTTGTGGTGTTGTGGTGTTGTGGTGTTGTGGTGTTGTGGTGTTGTGGTGTTGTGGTGTTGTGGTGTTGTGGTGTTGTGGTGTTGTGGTGTTGTGGTGTTGTGGTGTPTGTALTACKNLTASGTYYLASDVSSAGTCFALGASNITINLNGHTITYGTGGGTAPTPAISACAGWYTSLTASQCLGGGGNLTVYGGNIVEAANAAPFSHIFWMGQGDGAGGGYIHDLNVTFQSVGSQFFHGEVDGGGYKIQNNVVNDNVTNIQQPGQSPLGARAAFQGYVIHTDEEGTGTPAPDDISGNTFNGSAQGGVADGVANSQIYNNIIKLTSYYSNDYGVLVAMNGQNVHDNTITGRGRGLDGESSGFILNHNTVNVAEEANNSEYNGCELDGTYGIRVKNYDWPNSTETGTSPSTNFQITNNTITTPATVCPATAMDFTDMNSLVTGTISGNTFSAPAGSGGLADALGFEGVNAPNLTFQTNQFSGPTCVLIGGNGDIPYGSYTIQAGQTWSCAAGPTVAAQDDTYGQTGGTPPVITIDDSIPNPSLSCLAYSTAVVSIGGTYKSTCNLQGK